MSQVDVPRGALELARWFEGLSLVPYLCPAGKWTIGYGHRCSETHPKITNQQAEDYLYKDMMLSTDAAIRLCPTLLGEPERRLAAIADFVFNLGPGRLQASTLRRKILARNWYAAIEEIVKWVYGDGIIQKGLVLRRHAEADMLR